VSKNTLKLDGRVVRSYHAHGAEPIAIAFDGEAPATAGGDSQAKLFLHEAELVAEALVKHLPGGLLHALHAVLMYRLATQLVIPLQASALEPATDADLAKLIEHLEGGPATTMSLRTQGLRLYRLPRKS